MVFLWIILAVVAAVLGISYGCFRLAFYVPRRSLTLPEEIETPEGEIYDPYREKMIRWGLETRALPHEEVSVTSFDGLILRGNYYEYAPGAPIELMFHGYRGTAERDLSGGVQRCFKLGRSALVVNQRCGGLSEGRVITFGIKESRDCLTWLEFMGKRFGKDAKIILTGISMGASTVMMAAGKDLPDTVIGVLADCGYSSPRDIMKKVIRDMGLPPALSYPFVRLGAILFGGFDPDSDSPAQALRKSKVPVIFFHGEDDAFVPCEMSRINYEACASRKMLVTVPGAGHGLSYPIDPDRYLDSLREFFGPEASANV